MSQGFKFRYDQLRENNPQNQPAADNAVGSGDSYFDAGHARHICFGWPDGRRLFLNYSYLISGEYLPGQDQISLQFTSHAVVLSGAKLDALYELIMHQMAKLIFETDPRYETLEETNKSVVHSIAVTKMD